MATAREPVDLRGARFNQGVAAALLLLAFVINWPLLIPALATVLLAGSVFGPRYGLFLVLHSVLIAPRLKPPAELEDPRPMRFAAMFGAMVLAASTAVFIIGGVDIGWSLALITAVVTGLSATTDICVGCEIYSAVRVCRATEGSVEVVPRLSQPQPPRVDRSGVRLSHAQWRARWLGLRTLGQWVEIVDQTSAGDLIIRAGRERLLLPLGDRRFWPLVSCPVCQGEMTSLDISRHRGPVLCANCITNAEHLGES